MAIATKTITTPQGKIIRSEGKADQEHSTLAEEETTRDIFEEFDSNKNGFLEESEIATLLQTDSQEWRDHDTEGADRGTPDGKLSLEELLHALRNKKADDDDKDEEADVEHMASALEADLDAEDQENGEDEDHEDHDASEDLDGDDDRENNEDNDLS